MSHIPGKQGAGRDSVEGTSRRGKGSVLGELGVPVVSTLAVTLFLHLFNGNASGHFLLELCKESNEVDRKSHAQ